MPDAIAMSLLLNMNKITSIAEKLIRKLLRKTDFSASICLHCFHICSLVSLVTAQKLLLGVILNGEGSIFG